MGTNIKNIDKSVNCYFCGELFNESDCINADEFNDNDGGSICEKCLDGATQTIYPTGG